MRRRTLLAALCLIPLGLAPSCSTRVRGQLMLVLQTDMSLPKDIDLVRIVATRTTEDNRVIYQHDFPKFGGADSIKLPGTLPFLASDNPADAIRIRVIASRGSDESVRVLREVVTTIPADRVASLPLTLEFLCNGEVEVEYKADGKVKRDEWGNVIVKSTCPDGLTCVAGSCQPQEVETEALPDYEEKEVFGGGDGDGDGLCFDTGNCFDNATDVALDLVTFESDSKTCTGSASGDVNIALRTQGGGICGASGCFVALDAESSAGWKKTAVEGRIELPASVCKKLQSGAIVGVVAAPVDTTTCQLKRTSIPTCGPWSSSGADVYTPPAPQDAVAVAVGQVNPASLAEASGTLYWVSRGNFDAVSGISQGDGAVKRVSAEGGEPTVLAEKQSFVGKLALDDDLGFVVWTGSQTTADATSAIGQILWARLVGVGPPSLGQPLLSLDAPADLEAQPDGIAFENQVVYWTEPKSQRVHRIATGVESNADGDRLVVQGGNQEVPAPDPSGNNPYAIAAANDDACWVYRDKLGTSDGVVACSLAGQSVAVAMGQRTPHAVAMGNGFVYWANFDAAATEPDVVGGGIFKVAISGSSVGQVEEVAREDYPGGLAVDGETLYWTSRSRGTVTVRSQGDAEPTDLVEGQSNPGAITTSKETVYWINEGTNEGGVPDGAIMKAAKPSPP